MCPGFSIKLPMLSKDGRKLAGLDLQTQTSAIWDIKPDFSCVKIHDLGLKTGKLNLNYENSKVTYHIYAPAVQLDPNAPDDQSDHYVAIPSADFVSDIFVMELKSNKVTRITANKDMNSMYPDFTRDGRLVFISHPHDPGKKVGFTYLVLSAVGFDPLLDHTQDVRLNLVHDQIRPKARVKIKIGGKSKLTF